MEIVACRKSSYDIVCVFNYVINVTEYLTSLPQAMPDPECAIVPSLLPRQQPQVPPTQDPMASLQTIGALSLGPAQLTAHAHAIGSLLDEVDSPKESLKSLGEPASKFSPTDWRGRQEGVPGSLSPRPRTRCAEPGLGTRPKILEPAAALHVLVAKRWNDITLHDNKIACCMLVIFLPGLAAALA